MRKDSMTKVRAFDLELKSVTDDGTFSGYGSVWGVVDTYREAVAKGAFLDSLRDLASKGRKVPILWQHDPANPIGVWDLLKEDEHGLYGEGTLWTDVAPFAKLAHRGMKAKAITGLSIGYYVRQSTFDEVSRLRTLTSLDLREVSVVTNPANDEARIDQIKAKLANGETPTDREFRKILRERGFSNSDAEEIASLGFLVWSRRESNRPLAASRAPMSDLVQALGTLSLPK